MHRSLSARLGLPAGLAALLALGSAAQAQEGMMFKNLLGSMGVVPSEKDPIHYRERAPLVLPPKTVLRPPSQSYASSNPQWPVDPDVASKRRKAAEDSRPVTWSETRRALDNNPRMSPYEIQAGRIATSAPPVPGTHRGDNAQDILMANPDAAGPKASDERVAQVEPRRRALTDPPAGLRRSSTGKDVKGDFTPRVDQQNIDANPMNWLTRRFKGDQDD